MSITAPNTDRALLVLRVAVALVFIVHGCMKLFVMGHAGAYAVDARLAPRSP